MRIYDLEKRLLDELNDNIKEIKKEEYKEDYIHEIIDGLIPVYTSDLLELCQDNLYLATSEPEIYGFDGSHTPINGIVGNVYQYLDEIANDWLNENRIKYND